MDSSRKKYCLSLILRNSPKSSNSLYFTRLEFLRELGFSASVVRREGWRSSGLAVMLKSGERLSDGDGFHFDKKQINGREY